MRLGYNTNGFPHHRLDDALAIIGALGYEGVAITLDHHALDPSDPCIGDACARVRERLVALDLLPVVETGARFLLDPWRKHEPTLLSEAPRRETRERFLRSAVDVAAAIGAPLVSIWSGCADGGAKPAPELDERLAAGVRRLCEHAAERSVLVAFEPEPGMYVDDLAGFERLRGCVGHPALRLTLDVGHAHIAEGRSVGECIRAFAPLIANVHIEGMHRDRHEHLPPDEGDLDLGEVRAALDEIGYAGPANLELSRSGHDAVRAAIGARRSLESLGYRFPRPLRLP